MAKPKLPSGQAVVWHNADITSVYANIMSFGLTPFDISFTFGQIGEATHTEVQAHAKVKVTLAPEQAANLMKLLGAALQSYVSSNGQLRTGGALDMEALQAQIEEQKGENESR